MNFVDLQDFGSLESNGLRSMLTMMWNTYQFLTCCSCCWRILLLFLLFKQFPVSLSGFFLSLNRLCADSTGLGASVSKGLIFTTFLIGFLANIPAFVHTRFCCRWYLFGGRRFRWVGWCVCWYRWVGWWGWICWWVCSWQCVKTSFVRIHANHYLLVTWIEFAPFYCHLVITHSAVHPKHTKLVLAFLQLEIIFGHLPW